MNYSNFSFINNLSQSEKNYNLLVLPQYVLYITTHFRFSSAFPSAQLVDIMSYEVPNNQPSMSSTNSYHPEASSVIVYNFHSLYSQDRFFVFTQPSYEALSHPSNQLRNQSVASVSEVFPAANWLEREAAELNGLTFTGKKDLRNLMLQYGDGSHPFKKSFPSIGLKEMFYDPIKDTIIQNPLSVQL
jgi:NADH:ubiquinone oxidoreductase subunit C